MCWADASRTAAGLRDLAASQCATGARPVARCVAARELMAFIRLYAGTKADVFLAWSRHNSHLFRDRSRQRPAPRLAWTTLSSSAEERFITVQLGSSETFPAPKPNPYLARPA